MSTENLESSHQDDNQEVIKEEISIQYKYIMPVFFIVYYGSFIVPALIFMSFIMFIYLPLVLNTNNFILLFTHLDSLMAILILPVIIILCYLIHVFFVGLITRWFWRYTEKKSPSKDGIIPRNILSKTANYYHARSFMVKYPKISTNRGPFPWLTKWMFNFIGTSKIGKGTVLEENLSDWRFLNIGKNCYFGINGAMSSHAVEGIFGNITYFKVKVGDNVTTTAFNCIGPGSVVGDNTALLPMSGTTKHNLLKGNTYYFGAPISRIFKKRLMKVLQITESDLERAESLYNDYNQKKNTQKKKN
jgi:hypothetical protein